MIGIVSQFHYEQSTHSSWQTPSQPSISRGGRKPKVPQYPVGCMPVLGLPVYRFQITPHSGYPLGSLKPVSSYPGGNLRPVSNYPLRFQITPSTHSLIYIHRYVFFYYSHNNHNNANS